ncbi:hypothetical protein ABIE61_003355 [Marinobacterium sp. MBR-111]|jgi:hypothetical protein|uniref:hypothetical protein n=1 Tax=Marinobacterium sp. MBR-111 TaxID=3156463 RepID=UPI0033955947
MKLKDLMLIPLISCFIPLMAHGADVEIKGVYLGMSKGDYNQVFAKQWTVATHDVTTVTPLWNHEKLQSFTADFKVGGFEDILAAVKKKYPNLTCVSSKMNNTFGATLNQKTCTYKELTLQRYLSERYFGMSTLILGKPSPTKKVLNDI